MKQNTIAEKNAAHPVKNSIIPIQSAISGLSFFFFESELSGEK